ncbi:I78 family peptidase inhibitor [Stutzerimonas degradans]|uniref:I78 family peptidase inhibitor n=1 Tax=Stutzerimonas degradans TaxID=2968968 RepID=UPI001E57772D|nr:I78 family peptidase inhibitor [Stutzerimonas degradans]MCQ4275609.1 I78 family peptidase inhibitor [Stutzerimonas degradans]
MSKPRCVVLLFVASFLAGCQWHPVTTEAAGNMCDSQHVQHLLGRIATPQLLEQARELAGAQSARLLRPDQVVTLEYDSRRLNIHTDKNLKIQRLTCG